MPALDALVQDLSPEAVALQAEVVAPKAVLAPVASSATRPRALAILGSVERRGQWAVTGSSGALAVLGSVVIDLRDVTLPPGVTTIQVSAVLGSVEIIVPPSLAVESDGSSILGSFQGIRRVPARSGSGVARTPGARPRSAGQHRGLHPPSRVAHGARRAAHKKALAPFGLSKRVSCARAPQSPPTACRRSRSAADCPRIAR